MKKVICILFVITITSVMFLATGCVEHKHDYGDWIIEYEADCNYEGFKIRKCKLCDAEEHISISKLDHVYGEWMTESQSTCGNKGTKIRKCILCNFTDVEILPKSNEHILKLNSDRKPTCTYAGYQMKICSCHEYRSDVFFENLGGHIDDDLDGNCDICKEKVYRIDVKLNLENKAQATANDFVLVSYESGGVIPVTLGENSMIRGGSSFFLPTEEDPPWMGGNIVGGDIPFITNFVIPHEDLSSLTSLYYYKVYEKPTFGGMPEKVYIDIADTTQTALAVLRVSTPGGNVSFSQYFLFYGKRNDKNDKTAGDNPENFTEIKTTYGDTTQFKVIKYAYPDGEIIGTTPTVNVLLTEEITFIDLFLQQIDKPA